MGSTDDIEQYNLTYIINHVFLPPKLPQQSDNDAEDGNISLLKTVLQAAEAYRNRMVFSTSATDDRQWKSVIQMLTTMCALESTNSPSGAFRRAVIHMRTGDVIAMHIGAQNAGLILRQNEDHLVFESFEASPKAADVIATKGKLLCSYPGPAIAVSLDKAKDGTFITELASFLEKMKRDVLSMANEKGSKAGSEVSEERETSHPKFITGMLTGILRAIGQPAVIKRIQKRIADDVLWDNASIPWRRSPLWLVVRVALQTTLRHPNGSDKDYKSFMVFLIARIFDMAIKRDSLVESDILFIMNAKLSRRVLKADVELPGFVVSEARNIGDLAYRTLNVRWSREQSYHTRPFQWEPQSLDFKKDVCLTMQNSRSHLLRIKQLGGEKPEQKQFSPKEMGRIDMTPTKIPPLNDIKKCTPTSKDISLADFEYWVGTNLDTWLTAYIDRWEACSILGNRIDDYLSAAKEHYAHNPERTSIMILTTLELWIALDKVATKSCHLLKHYFPMFNAKSLRPLLLPHAQHVARLQKIEEYFENRRKNTTPSAAPIFSDAVTDSTFAVRYFDQSELHQNLRIQIQHQADEDRYQKGLEYFRKVVEYTALLDQAREMQCDYFTHWEEGWTRHDLKCRRCCIVKQACGMRIQVHEWPLPEDDLQSKVVVFELRCPMEFSVWRDMTYKVLRDVGQDSESSHTKSQPLQQLDNYPGLQKYFKSPLLPGRLQKLHWSSTSKAFASTHFRQIRFTSNRDDVFVNHALRYRLFDAEGEQWVDGRVGSDIIPVCTFRLPEGPYKKLQYSIRSTIIPPNQIIARQSECPVELSTHEYLAFGLLRAGGRLQWRNIIRELRSHTLTFSHEAVGMLIMQCAWQAERPGRLKTCRMYHEDLQDFSFGEALVAELGSALENIAMNWQEATTVHSLAILAIQLLSFTQHQIIAEGAVEFLRKARLVSLEWARELSRQLPNCGSGEMRESQLRVVQLAAICRTTFNVEHNHLEKLLHSDEDIAILVECSTMIHQNSPVIAGNFGSSRATRFLLDRDRRLSHSIENHLRCLILKSQKGIDLTGIWSAYRAGTPWKSLPKPNDRWMVSHTAGGEQNVVQEVHYNLLSGELLVEGLPLGRMQADYTSHPTYLELFGEKVLDVVPSNMKGMAFQTKHPISDYEVNFAMHGKELVVRTRRQTDPVIHQLIPRATLNDDFPKQIVEGHLHWLEVSTGTIELRDKENPWIPKKPHGWYISNSYGDGLETLLHLGTDERLIDIRSSTSEMISRVLGPLEYSHYIDICYSRSGDVTAHLPRLKLDFFISKGKLQCRQFSGMVVDEDQNIGTLVGLENRLVTRQGALRCVIIPHGKITFQRCRTHVSVDIDTKKLSRVKYHTYTIDPILGRLVGNGSLLSHLYKCYLHAVTSYCIPDGLTGRTGTEEAIFGLRAAETWSFQTLDTRGEEAELFKLIADLTPKRVYYPQHMKFMQQVKWSCLSPIVQHDEFHVIVDAVSTHASRFHIFYEDLPESSARYYQTTSKTELLERAAIRNASHRTEEFGGSLLTSAEDVVYVARDAKNKSTGESRVCHIAGMVESRPAKLFVSSSLQDVFEGWGFLIGGGNEELVLGYDAQWLNDNVKEVWCSLYQALTQDPPQYNKYQLMFLLSTFAYNETFNLEAIGTLLAVATMPQFPAIKLPNYIEYNLDEGSTPDKDGLILAVKECTADLEELMDLEDRKAAFLEDIGMSITVRIQLHPSRKKELDYQSRVFVSELISQWPCDTPSLPKGEFPRLDVQAAMVRVTPFFKKWYQNMLFEEFADRVQPLLDCVNSKEPGESSPYTFKTAGRPKSSPTKCSSIRLMDLFRRAAPNLPETPEIIGQNSADGDSVPAKALQTSGAELQSLLHSFRSKRKKGLHKTYADDLEKSLDALRSEQEPGGDLTEFGRNDELVSFKTACTGYLQGVFGAIEKGLMPKENPGDIMCFKAGLWPRISPTLLLQQLAAAGRPQIDLSTGWKTVLITYGKAITMLQRAERLLQNVNSPDFFKELENVGHQNWDPMERPDWLLMEIESNILVRPVQADIASQMIAPPSNKNAIVQLLMGEGKTSVVTPIVAAALADFQRLVRVVVLKPLSAQMYQTLVQKLGGLLNRRIFFMPFSRSVKMGVEQANVVRTLYGDCMRMGGIVLAQPEHIQSFKLLGLEWLSKAKNKKGKKKDLTVNKMYDEVAEILVETQRWLEDTSRDILDESDEILNVRHELIYSIGSPALIQNAPDRWLIIQEIFDLIQNHVRESTLKPDDYEIGVTQNLAQFPPIRILQTRAGIELVKDIASKIVRDGLPAINFRFLSPQMRRLAKEFITNPDMVRVDGQQLLDYCNQAENDISTATLFLLRGLFAHNIIFFILKEKRWKVDYGLDLRRTMLAVPYRAKDSPAGRAEFSHPDVAITLTCLSYYYGGLNEEQLETCFRGLYKSDSPTMQYERWIRGITALDRSLQSLSGVNLDDGKQWKEIARIFKHNKSVIDFYLAEVVFPREAKEFKDKLSTSGWDIAGEKVHPTTGFSGTNDNRHLLPLSIEQHDRKAQLNTNARVLSYLLQPENSYVAIEETYHEPLNFRKILAILTDEEKTVPVRVLLDVGAQVLELSNDQVAETWLNNAPSQDVEAAVFFDDKDILTVITRDGIREPLMISAFAQKLDKCVVYLDETHTRGTDLKLPVGTRAAVTLGPGLTKDRLVQACMRMRKLGHGHSVLFCAPLEIQRKLMREAQHDKREGIDIQVRDVILWCMDQTCVTYRKLVPVWAKQGVSYQIRFVAWTKLLKSSVKLFPQDVLEKEAKTLQEHYGFERSNTNNVSGFCSARQYRRMQFKQIEEKCSSVGVSSFCGAPMLEEQEQEQERELHHEIERVRDNQRPPRVGPVPHSFSDELKSFIQKGTLPKDHPDFIPAFQILSNTSAKGCEVTCWSLKLLVTSDFARVIDGQHKETDNFLRPVNWVVSSLTDPTFLVIMSPFEVNMLFSDIKKSNSVILHMYSPRVTKDTPSYEDLTFCATPPFPGPWSPVVSLVDQLNIFAGQLYFQNYKAYERVCGFLGLCLNDTDPGNVDYIASDGFVEKRNRQYLRMPASPFSRSPVLPLRQLMGIRRQGHSYLSTHMGQILHGRPLSLDDFV
ncbi:hypothetical protein K440DRAFT_665544 [Wilcoxina mikolae CBS 423.85]|nr:hypothetical protein K440DRAFT_665544 [Wilcoxina mikolae CBS 423.85]